jgi:ABC-type antimicrobial peptide transport system permease subunit
MILKEALFVVSVGVIGGLIMAFASGRVIASLLFGGGGTGVTVYIVVPLMLIGVAMLASFIPAYKATRIDPYDALRHE